MNPVPPISATPLPALPKSWSELTWQQLCDCWQVKLRYGGNADVARAAALMALLQTPSPLPPYGESRADGASGWRIESYGEDPNTGESKYLLSPIHKGRLGSLEELLNVATAPQRGANPHSRRWAGRGWVCTARELSWMAKRALPWFDFPYGDPGDKEQKDENGNIIKERRAAVPGYVSNMRDAMILPITETKIGGMLFALPQAACSNLTWEQYRALQLLTPQLFADGITDEQALDLQAQFIAHCLVAAQNAAQTADKFGAKHVFKYDSLRAERTIPFWKVQLAACPTLFHICFQVYQTAVGYYATVYPLLFNGSSKSDPLQDALTGETATIDAIMMKAHYTSQQEVYDTNLPFILDILNTMTKEAKEIEKLNSRIKKK